MLMSYLDSIVKLLQKAEMQCLKEHDCLDSERQSVRYMPYSLGERCTVRMEVPGSGGDASSVSIGSWLMSEKA